MNTESPRRYIRVRGTPEERPPHRGLREYRAEGIAQQERKRFSSWSRGMSTREMKGDVAVKRLRSVAGLALMTLALVACESERER
jgi:hypothetical protein